MSISSPEPITKAALPTTTSMNTLAQANDDSTEQEQNEHIFDKLIEKLVLSSTPDLDEPQSTSFDNNDPPLSLSLLAWHLHRLAQKAKFLAQAHIVVYHFLSWHQPALTVSGLVLWFYVCMYPMLLFNVPVIIILFCVLIPGYDRRHPNAAIPRALRRQQRLGGRATLRRPEDSDSSSDEDEAEYGSSGSRIGSKKSRAVLMERLRDLQNSLSAANVMLDMLQDDVLENPRFSFQRGYELESTGLFFLFLNITIGLNLVLWALNIPFNLIVLALGWSLVGSYHPAVQRYLAAKSPPQKTVAAESRAESSAPLLVRIKRRVNRLFQQFVTTDLSTAHEAPAQHVVEIFELQRQGLTPRQWVPWVYTTGLFDLSCPLRRSGARPAGTRFLADVQPPQNSSNSTTSSSSSSSSSGWFFVEEHPWALDSAPKQWVVQKGLRRSVDMDVDDAGWVYDYDVAAHERGEWRRRRWTRPVFRYAVD